MDTNNFNHNGTEINAEPAKRQEYDVTTFYDFLAADHMEQGYNDALINSDATHLNQNVAALKNKLQMELNKAKAYYFNYICDLDNQINRMEKSGLIDTSEDLKTSRKKSQSRYDELIKMEENANNNESEAMAIVISYKRGFHNGLAAIAHATILKGNF